VTTIFERMARQGHAMEPGDFSAWSALDGSISEGEFAVAVTRALERVGPAGYAGHARPDAPDPMPIDRLGMTQLAGLAAALLQAVGGEGLPPGEIVAGARLSLINPYEMTTTDVENLARWTAEGYPRAFGRAAAGVRTEPNVVAALLGPDLLLALGPLLGPAISAGAPESDPAKFGVAAPEGADAIRSTGPTIADEATGSDAEAGEKPPEVGIGGETGGKPTGMGIDVEQLTPPPSPVNTEPPWLTPAHPQADWPTWAHVQPQFRARWETRQGIQGRLWEDVEPAYQFAYARYRSPEYLGHPFPDVEAALQRDWESHGSGASWEQVRPDVEDAWLALQERSHQPPEGGTSA
jgi:hypothetical protein